MINLKQDKEGYWIIEGTRADLQYVPKVKQLVDCMYVPDLDNPDGLKLLLKILENYEL